MSDSLYAQTAEWLPSQEGSLQQIQKNPYSIYMTADTLLIPVLGICLQLNTKCFISENNSNISLEKAELNLFWYVSFCHVMTAAVLAHINHIFPADLENVPNRLL